MRNISPALAAHLAGDALTLATCIRLTRKDGQVYGFTTSTDALVIDGTLYQPSQGLDSSQLKSSLGTGVDNLDMTGLLGLPSLSSVAITTQDIRAGRYDSAELLAFVVNFFDLSMGTLILARGNVGEIKLKDGQFTAEFRSLSQKLAQQIGDVTSATCLYRALGQGRCAPGGRFADGKTLSDYRFAVSIASVIDARTITVAGRTEASDWFRYGSITPGGGLNAGIVMGIIAHVNQSGMAVLTLREAFPFTVAPGDAMTLEAGCDRNWATCKGKFQNGVNYGGQPFVPGNGKLLETGRA